MPTMTPPAIAIVEDELIVALDIRRFLERSGYRVVGVLSSGDELLERFPELGPDLVLMDIKIKGSRDGVETARVIHDKWMTPVILLTAYADDATVARAKLTEPFGYILKPFEERELRTAIELALYRGSMERKLRASEERYRRLFVEGLSGNVIADEKGRVLEANVSFRRILRLPPETPIQDLPGFFPDELAWESFRAGLRQGRRIENVELELRAADGSEILVLAHAGLIGDDEERRIQGEFFDLTERKRLEAQLVMAQKMEAIGRLAGGVAHDFNNILTAILGYTTLLADEIERYPGIKDDVEGIRKAASKAADLTRQLLAFSKRQPSVPRLLDLDAVVQDIEKMLRRLLTEDVRLFLELRSAPAKIQADPTQIEQVILNLVVNARDAMPQGGSISIATRLVENEAPRSLASGLLPAGSYVELAVRDTGAGIEPGILGRIFEPFFSTKPKDQGTGLGLSTVYGIVKQAGGGIAVDSAVGKGSLFAVLLPLDRTEGGKLSSMDSGIDLLPRSTRASILIVDDDAEVRELAARLLERAGHEVHQVSNAGEAILLAESFGRPLSLLLTDVVMPFMDGYRLSRRLQSLFPNLKSLFMSGSPEHALDAESENCFLAKPFSEAELLRAVDGVLCRTGT